MRVMTIRRCLRPLCPLPMPVDTHQWQGGTTALSSTSLWLLNPNPLKFGNSAPCFQLTNIVPWRWEMSSSPRSIQLLKERPRCFLWPRTRGNGSEKKPHCENTKSPFREKLKSLFSPLVTILHILSTFCHFYLMCTDGPAAGFCVSVSYGSSGHLNAFGLCWTTNLRGMRLTGEHWYTFAILFQQSHVVLFMSPFTTFGVLLSTDFLANIHFHFSSNLPCWSVSPCIRCGCAHTIS